MKVIKEFRLPTAIELLSVLMEIGDESVFFIRVYRVPGSSNNFIEGLIENMKDFVTSDMKIVLVGDFNLDRMLEANVEKINQLKYFTSLQPIYQS